MIGDFYAAFGNNLLVGLSAGLVLSPQPWSWPCGDIISQHNPPLRPSTKPQSVSTASPEPVHPILIPIRSPPTKHHSVERGRFTCFLFWKVVLQPQERWRSNWSKKINPLIGLSTKRVFSTCLLLAIWYSSYAQQTSIFSHLCCLLYDLSAGISYSLKVRNCTQWPSVWNIKNFFTFSLTSWTKK